MQLSGIRQKVFLDRYSLKSKAGAPVEADPAQMWRRVAKGIAEVEKSAHRADWEEKFYHAMDDFKYVPGGRILAGAGTGYDITYYNCFVIPSPKDSRDGILETLKQMVEIMAHGGGVGINLSSLRPRGARVKKVNGFSSGPINWAELFSVATRDIIQQGGTRRGALMLMLWDWHPDIEEFITVKTDLSRINGANLSVCVSDAFMEAVKRDDDWDLLFPDLDDADYDTAWDGYMHEWKQKKKEVKVYKTIKARDLWDKIAKAAWRSAEPGVVFMERYNKQNNNWYWNYINCVNPCVTGDTLVATSTGMRSMRELYENDKPFTAIVNGKPYLSTHVKKTGVKKVFRLKTKEGYELRLTGDHKVFTTHGKVAAEDLKTGDAIQLATGASFGTTGTLEEGKVLGWLVGDGAMKKDVATLYFYKHEKKELAPHFAQMVFKMVDGEQVVTRAYPIAPQYVEKEDKAVVESVRLWRIALRYGITRENKYVVPRDVFTGSEMMQRGYLQGLFSSDGHVAGTPEKGVSIRLTSVSKSLLIDVQRLLLNFGITGKIYDRRDAGMRLLPDGKGGHKEYRCKAYHDLVISKSNLGQFAAVIGFLQKEKQEKLRLLLSAYNRGPYRSEMTATFDYLQSDGTEDVFDITVSDVHRFSANGLVVANCGEEGLPAWGVCNLGSLNLSAFVKSAYDPEKPGEMDYESLAEHAKIAVRFQDNVVDSDAYIFDGIRKMQLNGERRIGLGTMGLGDTLIKMHLRYGSDESLVAIEKMYQTIRDATYEAAIEIAAEKGAFPKFIADKYLKGEFIKKLPKKIRIGIKKHGIRNSILLMQAPTGSTSLMSGTTSGIEPVYEFEYIRRDRLGEHILRHPLYDAWLTRYKKSHDDKDPEKSDRPVYFVSANDLSPEDHVKVQATVQNHVDASISKTVNAPATHSVEDVKRLYTLAYDLGCKGIAYMREGSRQGVLERTDAKQEAEPVTELTPQIKPRPVRVDGTTYQVGTPAGRAYVTINKNGNDQPLEVFINVGKAGSDVAAMAEAIGRLISLNLRIASPLSALDRMQEICKQLADIGGSRHTGFGENRVKSLPDAIAKAMGQHFNFKKKGNGVSIASTNGDVMPAASEELPPKGAAAHSHVHAAEYDLCPECGVLGLAYEEGCKKCYSCGYSEC